jgi:hypothetical protein
MGDSTFDIITSKLSSIFAVTGDEFTLMRDERTSTSRSLSVRQVDEQLFDDESSQERIEDPQPRPKRQATIDMSAPNAKRPTPQSSVTSEFKEFLSALTESDFFFWFRHPRRSHPS